MFNLLLTLWLFQLNSRSVAACEGECVTNFTKTFIGNYSKQADPLFAGLSSTIQASLPNLPAGKADVLIEPIRKQALDTVHDEVKKGLQLISSQKGSNTSLTNLTSDKLASSVLQVVSLVLNETLSAVTKAIATLEGQDKKASGIPSVASPAKAPSPVPQPPQVPVDVSKLPETPGRPFAVSTIPINAPGAPKLPKREEAHEVFAARDTSAPSTLNSREVGRPTALESHSSSAGFQPVYDPAPAQDPCAIKLIENIICLRNLPFISGILRRRSIASFKSPIPTLLSSRNGQTFSSIHKRGVIRGREPTLKRAPRLYIWADMQLKSPFGEPVRDNTPSHLPYSIHEIDADSDQKSSDAIQTTFRELDSDAEGEERRLLESILQSATKVFEARLRRDRAFLWEQLTKEHSAPSN